MHITAQKTVCALFALILSAFLAPAALAAPVGLPAPLSPELISDLALTPPPPAPSAVPVEAPVIAADTLADIQADLPTLPAASSAAALRSHIEMAGTGDQPKIVSGGQRMQCVTFARMLTGLDLFGDAKAWWAHARGLYDRLAQPVEGAVMVFSGSARLRHGHVAVVKEVLSAREVTVDHANWGNDGKVYLNTPVVDVSPNNDWSLVKVWNAQLHSLGTHVYRLSGFVTQ